MPSSVLPIVFLLASSIAVATGQTPPEKAGSPAFAQALKAREKLLDSLHDALAQAQTAAEANALAGQIWAVWLSHHNPAINDLMQQVLAARRAGRWQYAIELTGIILESDPSYAEAWNQRATIRFMLGQYEASLEDVAETLKREPRHFGALAGRGMIRLRQGRDALAWQNFEAARKWHPFVIERGLVPPSAREVQT
ncbi:MAG: tetratricopeptide repeat protein [Burkholderiaceae bacterium]